MNCLPNSTSNCFEFCQAGGFISGRNNKANSSVFCLLTVAAQTRRVFSVFWNWESICFLGRPARTHHAISKPHTMPTPEPLAAHSSGSALLSQISVFSQFAAPPLEFFFGNCENFFLRLCGGCYIIFQSKIVLNFIAYLQRQPTDTQLLGEAVALPGCCCRPSVEVGCPSHLASMGSVDPQLLGEASITSWHPCHLWPIVSFIVV